VAEKVRSFSEPGQKISAEPTTSTASTESAPEPVFFPANNTRDPCGSMIFNLAIQSIILSLDSQLNIWYFDDGTLAD
jgi:hypothetical protein